jgi:hypothetical protein
MTSETMEMNCTAFLGEHRIAFGKLPDVVAHVKDIISTDELPGVLIFDDSTSKVIEVDFRGPKEVELGHLPKPAHADMDTRRSDGESEPRRAGRPKLGVVPGEVTLLPRHWEWLKSQPGGASVTLRKLVDEARRAYAHQDAVRQAQENTYRFMTAMAGNRDHYEEALRALYAGDARLFYDLIASWAPDIRDHIKKLAERVFASAGIDKQVPQTELGKERDE